MKKSELVIAGGGPSGRPGDQVLSRVHDRRDAAGNAVGLEREDPVSGVFVSGSDGTRTRDLRRDRPAF
ncbi:MAG: hypothetical protein JWO17_1026 [Actinomycetia bacterium]|jgi:hypothetical protein|nr:hypothetical protein [Actinomycetes bacterium]